MFYKGSDIRAQMTVINLSEYRMIFVRADHAVEMVIDVVGYYATSGSLLQVLPVSTRLPSPTSVAGGGEQIVNVGAVCDSTTTAVFANIAVVNAAADGYLQARRDTSVPLHATSTVNYTIGDTVSNGSFIAVSGQQFRLYSSASVNVIVDIFGCYRSSGAGLTFAGNAIPPVDVSTTLSNGGSAVVASSNAATLISLNISSNTAASYLQTYRTGGTPPGTSAINALAGDWVSNTSLVALSAGSSYIIARGGASGSTTVTAVRIGTFL
jgi:hypothetical protein